MENNSSTPLIIGALILGGIIGFVVKGASTTIQSETPTPTPMVKADKPSTGWDLHIDAKMHFPGKADMIAHHYCKQVSTMWECQLFDSDSKDARLVGVEVVIDTPTYNTFTADEKARWHYHKTEIPKVDAKLPDLSAEEATKVVKTLEETYGKIYLLWDPSVESQPVGNPSVTILK